MNARAIMYDRCTTAIKRVPMPSYRANIVPITYVALGPYFRGIGIHR
jgi:hypothetical protein